MRWLWATDRLLRLGARSLKSSGRSDMVVHATPVSYASAPVPRVRFGHTAQTRRTESGRPSELLPVSGVWARLDRP